MLLLLVLLQGSPASLNAVKSFCVKSGLDCKFASERGRRRAVIAPPVDGEVKAVLNGGWVAVQSGRAWLTVEGEYERGDRVDWGRVAAGRELVVVGLRTLRLKDRADRVAIVVQRGAPLKVKAAAAAKPDLRVSGLKVGAEGAATRMSAKVWRVLGPDRALVGLEDSVDNRGAYATLVVVKVDTAGLVDGKFFDTAWKDFVGSARVRVTGTTKVGGRTLFVIEAVK